MAKDLDEQVAAFRTRPLSERRNDRLTNGEHQS